VGAIQFPKQQYRKDIDGLRALAVVPVVFSHAGFVGFSGGFVGVDIFFVISGYLITGLLYKEMSEQRFSIVRFYERRARRILPALFAVLFALLVVAAIRFPPELFIGLARSTISTLMFVSNYWFFHSVSDYFAYNAAVRPLLHTWSLAVEEQFYIVFPLLLLWIMRWRQTAVVGILVALSLASLAGSIWATPRFPEANFYFSITRAWELGIGAILALMVGSKKPRRVVVEMVAGFGLACLVYSVTAFDDATAFPGLAATVPCLGAAAIIWSGRHCETVVSKLLSNRILVGIGLISYSLYLWHWPIIVLFRMQLGINDLPFMSAVIAVLVSLGFAIFSWKFIEQPFRKPAHNGYSRRFVFMASTGAIVGMLMVAGAVELRRGFPGRVPADILATYQAARDSIPNQRVCYEKVLQSELCSIGNTQDGQHDYDILFWGDSYAGALETGIDTLALEMGLDGSVVYKAACPPVQGVMRIDMATFHACDAFNSAVMAMLRAGDDYPVVILAARWTLNAEGSRAQGEYGRPAILRNSGDYSYSGGTAKNFEVFEDAFLRTVLEISETGRRVFVIAGIPEIGWDVPQTLGNIRFMGARQPATPTRSQVDARNARVNRVFSRAAKEADLTVISLVATMCAPICSVERDGRPLYRDQGHLNNYGANILIPDALRANFIEIDWSS